MIAIGACQWSGVATTTASIVLILQYATQIVYRVLGVDFRLDPTALRLVGVADVGDVGDFREGTGQPCPSAAAPDQAQRDLVVGPGGMDSSRPGECSGGRPLRPRSLSRTTFEFDQSW